MYRTYNARPIPQPYKPTHRRSRWLFVVSIVLLLGTYAAYTLLRPLEYVLPTIVPPVVPASISLNTPWPSAKQVALGADDYGILETHGEMKPAPTASVAKVITALAVLDKKPLSRGTQGPSITLTEKDVALYNQYIAKDGAAVPIVPGETITQYQALQAMMLPSANNIADTTAVWAFGSMEAYTQYANTFVKNRLGMVQTTVADASGFSPSTVSTARDLIKLGNAAIDHAVLSEIVAQKEAEFPNYGSIRNTNNLLGQFGIRGIKTGNTEEAGGCYLAAADIVVDGQTITLITAVMGAPSRPQAMRESIPLIQSSVPQFKKTTIIKNGQNAGYVSTPWGTRTDLIATSDVTVLAWAGNSIPVVAHRDNIAVPSAQGTIAGSLIVQHAGKAHTSKVAIKTDVPQPNVLWRLTHPW